MEKSHYDKTGSKTSATENQEKLRHIQNKSFAARMGVAGKTPWDFIQLLLIPLVLAGVGYWFTAQQNQTSLQVSERQHETDIQLAVDQQRETTLQTYLDNMSDLLLKQNLAKSKPGDEVSQVARQRTLTTLRRLDATRNEIVLQFLRDAHLIGIQNAVIDLSHVSLRQADLFHANLSHVDLSQDDLTRANLSYAFLDHANLSSSYLAQANLSYAFLFRANLSSASLLEANLSSATLLEANLSSADLSSADLSSANYLDKTILKGARYNTKEILLKVPQGNFIYKLSPTKWPQRFDPKAAGAIEHNTLQ